MKKPISPIRVVMNAFLAAAAALGFSYQNPINKYEETPTNSQQTNKSKRLLEITRPSMAAANSERKQKNRVKFLSAAM
jgi:hypothetical protein